LERQNLGGGLPAARRSEGLGSRAEECFGAMQLSELELSLGEQGLGGGDGDRVCCVAGPSLCLAGGCLDLVPIVCKAGSSGRLEEHAWEEVVELLRLDDGLREPVAGGIKPRLVECEPTEREQDGDAPLFVAGTLGGGTVVAGDGRQLVFGANFANNVRLVGGSVLSLENFEGTLFVGVGSSVNLGNADDLTNTVTQASLVLESGGTLSGEGTLAALTLGQGSVLDVGNSPGVINVIGDLTLNGGSQRFEVRNALDTLTGLPSTPGEGYDFVSVQGVLDLSALSVQNRFLFELISLNESDGLGALADFDANGTYMFTLYQFGSRDLGSHSVASVNSLFEIDADGFLDMNGQQVDGSLFSIALRGNTLVLNYGVVPEPSTYGLMLGGLALALSAWRRRRQPPAAKA
jgi:hypothetical protein